MQARPCPPPGACTNKKEQRHAIPREHLCSLLASFILYMHTINHLPYRVNTFCEKFCILLSYSYRSHPSQGTGTGRDVNGNAKPWLFCAGDDILGYFCILVSFLSLIFFVHSAHFLFTILDSRIFAAYLLSYSSQEQTIGQSPYRSNSLPSVQ